MRACLGRAYGGVMWAQRKPIAVSAAIAAALSLALAGCSNPDTNAPNDEGTSAATKSQESGDSSKEVDDERTERGVDLAATNFAIDWETAIDTATGNFDGDLSEVEFDWSSDRYVYTVELFSDADEYTIRIDADTGEVLGDNLESIESDDLPEKTSEVVDPDQIVSWADAVATALDAQKGAVTEWKLEGTEHGPQWQFDIDSESGEDYEVTVNAETGDLISTDN